MPAKEVFSQAMEALKLLEDAKFPTAFEENHAWRKASTLLAKTLPHGTKTSVQVSPVQEAWQKKCESIMNKHDVSTDMLNLFYIKDAHRQPFNFKTLITQAQEGSVDSIADKVSLELYESNIRQLTNEMKKVRAVGVFARNSEMWAAGEEVANALKAECSAVQAALDSGELSSEDEKRVQAEKTYIEKLSGQMDFFLDKQAIVNAADAMEKLIAAELKKMESWPASCVTSVKYVEKGDSYTCNLESPNPSSVCGLSDMWAPTLDALRLEADSSLANKCSYGSAFLCDAMGRLTVCGPKETIQNNEGFDRLNKALETLRVKWLLPRLADKLENSEMRSDDIISHPLLKDEVPIENTREWFVDFAARNAGAFATLKDAIESGTQLAYDVGMDKLSPDERIIATIRAEAIAHAVDGVEMVQSENEQGEPLLQLTISDPELIQAISEHQEAAAEVNPSATDVKARTREVESDSPGGTL